MGIGVNIEMMQEAVLRPDGRETLEGSGFFGGQDKFAFGDLPEARFIRIRQVGPGKGGAAGRVEQGREARGVVRACVADADQLTTP